ncbi:MAG: hypothetical protein C0594_03935, partial [Marinilabiliales bacterium]
HPSDLYYCTFDGGSDYIPELYYGRFSAENATELQAILDKTLMNELYTWPDDNFLNECVMVAGVDNSYAPRHGNGQIFYGINEYFNLDNGYTNVYTFLYGAVAHPYQIMSSASADASDSIISKISNGVGFANYTAHCSENGWADPSFSRSDIDGLANTNEYPVMIGNCCLSNKFNTNDAFGEMLLYAENKGAVGYIGGSNNTLWDEDFYWSVGVNSLDITSANAENHAFSNTGPGAYDGIWHMNGEAESDWFVTTRAMLHTGNLSVESSGSSNNKYYWEIYHLMGDPSLMPYFTKADPMTVSYINPLPIGTTNLVVNTEPYAYVAISKDGVLLDAQYTGSGSSATLNFSALSTPGTADIVVTKQNKQPYIGTINVIDSSNQYDLMCMSIEQPNGSYHINNSNLQPKVIVKNLGNEDLSSFKLRYYIDSDPEINYDWTGNLATYDTAWISFPAINLPPGQHTITAYTYMPNGNTDEFTVNDTITSNFEVYYGDIAAVAVISPETSYCQLEDFTPSVRIKNLDAENVTSLIVSYRIDGGSSVSQTWNGSLSSNETTDISFPATTLTQGNHTIVYTISMPNGGPDSDISNNTIELDYTANNGQIIIFDLTTDQYGSETSWNLTDSLGTVLYSAGPYSDGSEQNYVYEFCLPIGCYTLTINDTYGDGICSGYGNGSYSIYNSVTSENYGSGCNFTNQELVDFCVIDLDSPPIANFSSLHIIECNGEVEFTDLSSGIVDTWNWDFGDGTSSTEQDPVHTYTSNGTYTVSLTVSNSYGNNTHTESDLLNINIPQAPTTTNGYICNEGSVYLEASGSGTLNWYDSPTGGNLINTGTSYTTPVLATNETYYVEDVFPASVYNLGETNNTSGGEFFTSNTRYLIFDVYTDITLLSVEVNSNSTADRTIQLLSNTGTVLQSTVVNIPAGISRVDLNFPIAPGTNYRLKCATTPNLFRSEGSLNYPYEIANVVSIQQSDAGTGYYYFFYDWEVKVGDDCTSPRTPVTAEITEGPDLTIASTGESSPGISDGTATASASGDPPFSYLWDSNASNQTTEIATGLAAGEYIVTVTNASGCYTVDTAIVEVGVTELS